MFVESSALETHLPWNFIWRVGMRKKKKKKKERRETGRRRIGDRGKGKSSQVSNIDRLTEREKGDRAGENYYGRR